MSNNNPKGNNSILNIFKNEFASTVNVVHINSLNKDVKFREVTVTEQKSLSKTMIENENRKDIIYDTQCALINKLCLDKLEKEQIDPISGEAKTILVDFDIYNLTEFDRIRILMEVYQNNYFKNDVTFTCEECGAPNTYKLDFSKVTEKLNDFTLDDVTYYMEDKNHKYCFILNYPSVRTVSNFYKNYSRKYKGASPKQREVLDNIGNVDYINLFIKSIEVINKITGEKNIADLSIMTYSDIEELISYMPQNIIFDEEKGVLKYVATEFLEKINSAFEYEKCLNCGAVSHQSVGGMMDFL
jgi:hypothetical protein